MYPTGTAVAAPLRNSESNRLTSAGATDRGRQREWNEDRIGAYPGVGLFVLADGMGGAAAGGVAARMAVDLVCDAFVDPGTPWPRRTAPSAGALLVHAIQRANKAIHDVALHSRACRGMGTTTAALLACGSSAAIAHVGDSRIYRLRADRLVQLTEDHSLFNDLVREGKADPDRPEAFEHHHVITRAVGIHPTVEVDARLVDVAQGDSFLLCSDGLCGVVPHDELAEILRARAHVEETVTRLIARANDRGGPDNIAAIVLRWDAAAAPARESV